MKNIIDIYLVIDTLVCSLRGTDNSIFKLLINISFC